MSLDERTKALIAVGAAIASNCEGWIQHHASRACEIGVDVQDIMMAIEIGKATRKGAAARIDEYVSAHFKECWDCEWVISSPILREWVVLGRSDVASKIATFFKAGVLLPTRHLVCVIPATVLIGLVCGRFVDTSALSVLILPMVVLMVYPSMIGFSLSEFIHFGEKKVVLLSLFINFLLVPPIAYFLGLYFLVNSPGLFAGIVITSLLPTSHMTVGYTVLAKGNVKAAIKVTMIGLVLGSLLLPWYLNSLLEKFVPFDGVLTLKLIGVIVFLPLIMGMMTFRWLMTRYTMNEFNESIKSLFPGICAWGALIIIFISISTRSRTIFDNPDTLVAALLVQAAFYFVSYVLAVTASRLGRLSKEDGYALVYGTVLRNLAISIGLGSALFGSQAAFMVSLAFLFQPAAAVWFAKLNERYRLI